MKKLLSKAMMDVQWSFISIATASLAHFLLRIILGRDLGAEGLGVYTLAFTIYLFGMQFAAFGIGPALTKYVAESIEDKGTILKYVSSGLTASIITGVAMGVVLFLLAPVIANTLFHTPALEDMVRLTALCYPFIAIQKAVLGTLNGFRRMRLYAFLNIVQNVSVVAVSIALVRFTGLGVMGAVIGFVVPTILIGALSPFLIRDSISLDGTMWNVPAIRATTVFGFYIVLGSATGYLNTQADSILIGYFMNPTEVGIFAVSVLFAQTLILIPSAVQNVTSPVTAMLYGKGDIEGIRRLYYSTLKKSLIISCASAVLLAVFGLFFITLIFSEEFTVSYIPMLILLPGYAIGSSFSAVGATLQNIDKVHVLFRINIVCGVMNVVLDILLIPFFGIYGAALATSTTMLVNFSITVKLIDIYIGESKRPRWLTNAR